MPTIRITIICILALALAILRFAPGLAQKITLFLLGQKGRADVGRRALEAQPDHITLAPRMVPPGVAAAAILEKLKREGFEPAGSFTVIEMGGLPVHFMVKPADAANAVVYEHPQAGVWLDLFSQYQDGTSFTLATGKTGGSLEQRPGHPSLRVPGTETGEALELFLAGRTPADMVAFEAVEIPRVFVAGYAESIAWRKQRGVSADEVQLVGMEKFA